MTDIDDHVLSRMTPEDTACKEPVLDADILLSVLGELKEQADVEISQINQKLDTLSSQMVINHNYLSATMKTIMMMLRVQPQPPSKPEPKTQIQRANFLEHYGDGYSNKRSTHMFLSDTISDAERIEWVKRHAAEGMTHFHVQMYLDGDYRGKHKFRYEHKLANYCKAWLTFIRDSGLEPIVWLMSDDGFSYFDRANAEAVKAEWKILIDDVLKPIEINHVVPGLESREYWTHEQHVDLFGFLREQLPDATLYYHTHPDVLEWTNEDWFDVLAFQSDFSKSIEQNVAQLARAKAYSGKPVVAAEHSKNGFETGAKRRAEALIDAGAIGSWTG